MKIGIIGDLHFKDRLGYADLISDGREEERKAVLDFIVEKLAPCDAVVFLGDQFHVKNPSALSVRMFTEFIERFGSKPLYFLAGNHEVSSDGSSALDYLLEVRGKNWFVFKDAATIGINETMCTFLPWVPKPSLGVQTDKDGIDKIMGMIGESDYLFMHYAMTGCSVPGGMTDLFHEPVLPMQELKKRFKRIFGGHIHIPQEDGTATVVGSVFTNEAGETEKFICILDTGNNAVDKIQLPCRPILKLIDAKEKDMKDIPDNAIVKMEIRDPNLLEGGTLEMIEHTLKAHTDGFTFVRNVQTDRERLVDTSGGIPELSESNLLTLYAKLKGIDPVKLFRGYGLVTSL